MIKKIKLIIYLNIVLLITNFNLYSQVSASFTSNLTSGCAPLVVNFINTSSNSNSFFWDFNNGTTSILNNPSATFTNPGFYSIKLVARNGADLDSIISINYIHVLDKPTASFSYNIVNACETNNLINFNNTSIGAISYVWDFGNGDTNSLSNPSAPFKSDDKINSLWLSSRYLFSMGIDLGA